jgi:large subunit ribosomal protein L25
MSFEITAQSRTLQGSGASRRLRRAGKVPAIVYGGDAAPQVIELDHNTVLLALRKEIFHASVLSLIIDGQAQDVLLRDSQVHPYKQQVLHIDFQRVDATHVIHQKVPFHFVNGDVAPGVKQGGGTVSHVMNELEVSCLPKVLPEFIEVDLGKLEAGDSVHVSQVKLPVGVKAMVHGDPVVVVINAKKGGAATEEAPAA